MPVHQCPTCMHFSPSSPESLTHPSTDDDECQYVSRKVHLFAENEAAMSASDILERLCMTHAAKGECPFYEGKIHKLVDTETGGLWVIMRTPAKKEGGPYPFAIVRCDGPVDMMELLTALAEKYDVSPAELHANGHAVLFDWRAS